MKKIIINKKGSLPMSKRYCLTCNRITKFILNEQIGHSRCVKCKQYNARSPTKKEIRQYKNKNMNNNKVKK